MLDIISKSKEHLPREAGKTADKLFDRIYKHRFGKKRYDITDEDKKILERWDFAWLQLCAAENKRTIVNGLMSKFGISQRKAYDDIEKCMLLYNDPRSHLKNAKRQISEGWLTDVIQKAIASDKLAEATAAIKEFNELNDLKGVDSKFEEAIKNLQPAVIMVVANKDELQKMADSKLENIPTEDVDHEEV